MEKIAPTTTPIKPTDPFVLENKDYLLIRAIQELTNAINRLANT